MSARLRSKLAFVHRWCGIVLAFFVVLAGLSGALVSFQQELDTWLNRDLNDLSSIHVGNAAALPIAELIARVENNLPEARVVAVPLVNGNPGLRLLSFMPREGEQIGFDQAWVDAANGRLLATRRYGDNVLDARHIMPIVFRLHSSLLLRAPGRMLLGTVALLWFGTLCIGLYLAWPKKQKWGQVFRIHPVKRDGRSNWRLWFDLHRGIGLLSAPLFILVTSTAMYFSFDLLRGAVESVLPRSGWPSEALPLRPTENASVAPELALALAQASMPAARATGLRLDYRHGVYQIALKTDHDIGKNIEHMIFVDMQQARIVKIWQPTDRKSGDTFDAWMLPLHAGHFLGLGGRMLWSAAGVLPLLMVLSGLAMWWKKRRSRGTHPAP